MGIQFYCGINEKIWNYYPVAPGGFACVSPVFGSSSHSVKENRVYVPDNTLVIQDSGAFCDSLNNRLSFYGSLERQISHARKYRYEQMITHRASYDLLIDEKWIDGNRKKIRWNEDEAWKAVEETIDAAKFLSKNRLGVNLILSAQGVTLDQYMLCAKEITPLMTEEDMFGLGGWCILGRKKNNLRESFREVIINLIPFLSSSNIHRVHIWGVLYAYPLGELLWMCDKYNLKLSTDSAGPQMRPAMGNWGYADWKDNHYSRPSTEIRGKERARHVKAVIEWLNNFRNTKYYRSPLETNSWNRSM